METNLLSGVGHTIDFPNRNQILTDGFIWLEDKCANPPLVVSVISNTQELYRLNIGNTEIEFNYFSLKDVKFQIHSINGQLNYSDSISFSKDNEVNLDLSLPLGINIVSVYKNDELIHTQKIIIR